MAKVQVDGYPVGGSEVVLTEPALDFLAELHDRFAGTRRELLAARAARRQAISASRSLDFLPETAEIRSGRLVGGAGAARRCAIGASR